MLLVDRQRGWNIKSCMHDKTHWLNCSVTDFMLTPVDRRVQVRHSPLHHDNGGQYPLQGNPNEVYRVQLVH